MIRRAIAATSVLFALSTCDSPSPPPAAAASSTLEVRSEEPYGEAPDGSLFRYTQIAKLKVLEVVVGGASPDDALPVIVMLHGLADKPRLPSSQARHPRRGVRFLFPRGPYVFEQGFAWYPHRVREGKLDAMHTALEGTAEHFGLFMNEVARAHPAPCKPLIVGFSQGGMVSLATALARPETLSEALVVAAWLPPSLWPETSGEHLVPIRMMHGLRDRIVSPEPTLTLVETLKERGFPVEIALFEDGAHAMTREMDLTLGRWIEGALDRCVSSAPGPDDARL